MPTLLALAFIPPPRPLQAAKFSWVSRLSAPLPRPGRIWGTVSTADASPVIRNVQTEMHSARWCVCGFHPINIQVPFPITYTAFSNTAGSESGPFRWGPSHDVHQVCTHKHHMPLVDWARSRSESIQPLETASRSLCDSYPRCVDRLYAPLEASSRSVCCWPFPGVAPSLPSLPPPPPPGVQLILRAPLWRHRRMMSGMSLWRFAWQSSSAPLSEAATSRR